MNHLYKHVIFSLLLVVFLTVKTESIAQQLPKYLNTKLATELRVTDLVSRLSTAQKIKLLRYTSTEIDSNGLKIPAYNWWNECLHGVARAGKATVFPQTIGMAASWDTSLINQISSAISDEARAKYEQFSRNGKRGIYQGLNFWTPNINIFRDPRWGRGMETYGEDPCLTGTLSASFIKGIQGNNPNYFKAIATVKHFVVHSGPEATRHSINAEVSDRDLFETYTPAFKQCVQDAKVYSVMCAYNRFRGQPCCGNSFLLSDLLRHQWGFKGFIVTDCWAMADFYTKGSHEVSASPEEASAMAIKSGVDLECGDSFAALDVALAKKLITEAELDVALKRLFTARFKLGFFDKDGAAPYTSIPYSVVESKAHQSLALKAAQKSIVLLKNQNNLLPLLRNIKTLAVVGPNADDGDILLANYHGYPSQVVTPLEGLKNRLPSTKILYAKGSRHAAEVPNLEVIPADFLYTNAAATKHGMTAEYFKSIDFTGRAAISRNDKNINFYWINSLPDNTFDRENFSVKWNGYLKAPVSGKYSLGLYGYNDCKLYVNDSLIATVNSPHEPYQDYKNLDFKAGQTYKIRIDYISTKAAPLIQLKWSRPDEELEAPALAICKEADAVVMVMGLSPRLEGEEMSLEVDGFYKGDRTKLKLPDVQSQLIKKVRALGKPVILVLVNGSALAINWEKENIPAIVEAWYGGQEAGNAIADVLVGNYNPSGRLPVTFYTSEEQLPPFENYDMRGRTYRYLQTKPLYEFGYGLSYTNFTYSQLKANTKQPIGQKMAVSIQVKNSGKRDGEEVVQLYVNNPDPLKHQERYALKAFRRIFLKSQESAVVTFELKPEDFSVITKEGKRTVKPGSFTIYAGGKQPELDAKDTGNVLRTTITLQGTAKDLKL
ncbi:glycoside hydrolase family 3 C-terminal domain-containing protein [Pedobacter sp. MC2016-14]|uniref:glycoside hydrolase family 3 protein n=1 Tax=Pedobacter sp. MC2016-14 TaxID=2897327 RepID=UPI001E29EF1A|nr:glycoside hydrolase family 3 protein [Pedobacter sp. MC2016-14]MCD0490326.1 glycoside hydrolase family 3 C-terminal domain-containing protein [Pedobacter sp. MC2016-14]